MSLMYDLGILGGGQLARMSTEAAHAMGLTCLCLDPDGPDSPAGQITACLNGSIYDAEQIANICHSARWITLENEFIPAQTIREALAIAGRDESVLTPGLATLATIQDKWLQRQAYRLAGLPSPKARPIDPSEENEVEAIVSEFGLPVVAKSRLGGYDGKGTRTLRSETDVRGLIAEMKSEPPDRGWLVEAFVPFCREVSVMVFRNHLVEGVFPTMETMQSDHVCDLVFPAGADASEIALAAVRSLDGFGLFGVELFDLGAGQYSINEVAPRPHNTGHYTQDWGSISQFEQHVRLATHLPVATPDGRPTAMANLLGQHGAKEWRRGLESALEAVPTCHVHWYGKASAKPGRKMGHINVVGDGALERVVVARQAFYEGWTS